MNRYWVIGGDYVDMEFRCFRDDRPTVLGPFESKEEATETWRQLSRDHSSKATTRFSIMSETFRLAM